MSEQSPQSSSGPAADRPSSGAASADWRDHTTPGITAVSRDSAPVGSGAHGYAGPGENYYTTPQYSTRPVAVRRPDPLAGLLLVLAGIAAGVSLVLRWTDDRHLTGWNLLRSAFDDIGAIFSNALWQPTVIVLGGGVLFVFGLLMLVPARAHRILGLLALLVSCGATAGVLVPLADADWHVGNFAIGFYLAMAVAGLGLLGSLKALFTGPRLSTGAPTSV